MKHINKRWLSLAIAPALLALMSAAQPAYATDYSYSCADVPASIDGNVLISDENACTISHSVAATGNITVASVSSSVTAQALTSSNGQVTVTGTSVTTEDITASSHIQVDAIDGTISLGDITANTGDSGGNIMLTATGNIGTGNISTTGSSGYGAVQIRANTDGGNTVFNIGGGTANGTGTIDTRTSGGGGSSPTFLQGGLYVINGNSASTGGITLNAMSDLLVESSGSRSGLILLDAQAGNLTFPSGTLSSDGQAGNFGGYFALAAHEIIAADGAILSAKQGAGVGSSSHGIHIATETVNVSGSDGLLIRTDGNSFSGFGATLLMPEGGLSISSNNDVVYLTFSVAINDLFTKADKLEIAGSGKFKATANGNNQLLGISGYPLKFSADNVELEAKGATDHNIKLGFYGTFTGGEGFTVSGSGNTKIDASGIDGNGGKVEISGAVSAISSSSFIVKADGPATGNGDGGTIKWYSSELSVDEATTVSFTADAALAGTGNAKSNAIDFRSEGGAIAIGTEAGQASFSAKGGGVSGNGGTIKFVSDGAVTVYGAGPTASVFDVSVPGETGNGGKIDILAVQGITFDGDASYLKADSGSVSGDGGTIKIDTSVEQVIIGTAETGAVDLSAKSNGDGKGGTVDIYSPVGIRANGAHINVSAGGSEQGGTIFLNAGSIQDLYISGTLRADGGAAGGNGGSITLYGGKITLPGDANTEVKANGKGTGDGGYIFIVANNEGNIRIGNGTAEVRLEARSEESGNGGTINLFSDGEVYLYGAAIDVNVMAGDGDGGTIIAESQNDSVIVVGDLTAAGFGEGSGGTIELTAALNIDLTDAYIRAPGGLTGNGGQIRITTLDDLTIDDLSEVSVLAGENGDGQGGVIEIKADSFSSEGKFKASGFGNGSGGSLSIETQGPLSLVGEVSVNGGCNDGNGGNVNLVGDVLTTSGTISSNAGGDGDTCLAVIARGKSQTLSLLGDGVGGEAILVGNEWIPSVNTRLNSNGSGTGKGGHIHVQNTNPVHLESFETEILSAKGGVDGEGGFVEVDLVSSKFDINTVIKVEAGDNKTDTGTHAGEIKIKDSKCYQYVGDKSSWPRTYWICSASAASPNAEDLAAYEIASSVSFASLKSIFVSEKVELYLFETLAEYKAFMVDPFFTAFAAGGVTSKIGAHIYVGPWKNGSKGDPNLAATYTPSEISEVTGHELGHAVDIIRSGSEALVSTSSSYKGFMDQDIDRLDMVMDNTLDPPAKIRRLPCAKTVFSNSDVSGDPIPFKNAIHAGTNLPICVDEDLNPEIRVNPWPVNILNSDVLKLVEPGVFDSPYAKWIEAHAHIFGLNVTSVHGARPAIDTVVDNGYFTCTSNWALNEKAGGTGIGSCP